MQTLADMIVNAGVLLPKVWIMPVMSLSHCRIPRYQHGNLVMLMTEAVRVTEVKAGDSGLRGWEISALIDCLHVQHAEPCRQ